MVERQLICLNSPLSTRIKTFTIPIFGLNVGQVLERLITYVRNSLSRENADRRIVTVYEKSGTCGPKNLKIRVTSGIVKVMTPSYLVKLSALFCKSVRNFPRSKLVVLTISPTFIFNFIL